MEAKIKKLPLITKEAYVDDNNQHDELYHGDIELSNMLASIETVEDDFLCTGSAEINSRNEVSAQHLPC